MAGVYKLEIQESVEELKQLLRVQTSARTLGRDRHAGGMRYISTVKTRRLCCPSQTLPSGRRDRAIAVALF